MSLNSAFGNSINVFGDDFASLDRFEPNVSFGTAPSQANLSGGGILDTIKSVGGSILDGLQTVAQKGLEILTEPEVIAAGAGIATELIRQRFDLPPSPRPSQQPAGVPSGPYGGGGGAPGNIDEAPYYPPPNAGVNNGGGFSGSGAPIQNYDAQSPIPIDQRSFGNGMDSMVLIVAVAAAAFILLMD